MKNKREKTHLLSNNIYIIKTVWQADKSRVFVDIFSQIFYAFSSYFLSIYFPKLIIDIIISQEEIEHKIRTAITITVIFAIALLFEGLFGIWYSRLFRPVSDAKIREKVSLRFYRKASDIELSCYENAEFYDRYTRAANELNERAITVMDNITFFIYCIIEMFLVGITILLTDIWSFLIVALFLTCYIVITPRINKARFALDMAKTKPDRIKSYVMRVLYLGDYAKEIKMYNIQNVLMKNYKKAMGDIDSAIKKHGPRLAFWRGTFDNTVHILRFGSMNIYIAARALIWKTIRISEIAVLITSINWLQWVLERFIIIYNNAHQHSLYIDNLRDFLDYQPKIISGNREPENGTLELKNVSFTYSGADSPILKNININIKQGQKIAIVGHNGAGKTTLIKLLLRLYDPESGEINLNGENIKNLNLTSYRDMFGTVFQDFKVFSMSVAENVLMRESTPDDEAKVLSALKESGVYERIMNSEKGISSNLTKEFDNDGLVLSGGETQKVAIARAFAKNNKILILDEPSSALDPIAEYEMFENLIRLSKGKTVIFISHRLSAAKIADTVFLLKDGYVIESGPHKKLMEQDGYYADMYKKQAENYVIN